MSKKVMTHSEARKEEIINACIELYKTLNFKDITIKDISEYTTFSRPSIYNYFETKEEIFLAIFQKEYDYWTIDLNKIAKSNKKLTVKQFANLLSKSLEKRSMLLKLLSMNLYDMERHSRIERLIEFKKSYASSITALDNAIKRAFPKYTKQQRESFLSCFLPFMIGIYPYTFASKNQINAMKEAGIKYKQKSITELSSNMIIKLLE